MERTKRNRIKAAVIGIAIALIIILVPIITLFLYVPSNMSEGLNDDIRLKISYYDYENYFYKNGDTIVPFRFKTPDKVEDGKTYPLLIFLHGGGSQGMDNMKSMCNFFIRNAARYGGDSYVLIPQVSDVNTYWDENILATLSKMQDEYLYKEYAIDTERVYLLGSSMGGFGCLSAIALENDRYAAAIVSAGALDDRYRSEDYSDWVDMPILFGHGIHDESVPIDSVKELYSAMKILGADVKFYEFNMGHEIDETFYDIKEIWDWLLSHKKVN